MARVTATDPASLAATARELRRLADDLTQLLGEVRGAARAATPGPALRADLTSLLDSCAATVALAERAGAALHRAAYDGADLAHARARLGEQARAAGLAVADAPHEDAPRLTLAPGIAGVADAGAIAARAQVLVDFTERRRALTERSRGQQAALRARLTECASGLEAVATALR